MFVLARRRPRPGRPDRAQALFDRVAGFANDLGLLAEEIDPRTGELLGNFPQAFSHIGLINAAAAIDQANGALPRHDADPAH
ncbi:glycoside hydrolase family 15 protein [Streptomyces sp. NPDC007057]|uniref:glycoside hydrolase family 15 protein n=1 Tax=Streptomyces sp. NPDC007057 TaxID=3154586 RepID=UPI0033C99569